MTSGGTSVQGTSAKRKRQDEYGATYYKLVKRPLVVQDYYTACGEIDLHNRFRQGQLRLEKFHQTKKWNSRMLVSILSSTMVDAFRAYEYHFPGDTQGGLPDPLESRLKSFVAKVIDEIKPAQTTRVPSPSPFEREDCRPELIGKYVARSGQEEGNMITKTMRCSMCIKRGHKQERTGRAPRTAY